MKKILLFIVFVSAIGVQAQDPLSQSRIEKLYHQGSQLISSGNYGAARTVFSEYLLATPASDNRRGEASYYIAFAALNLGHKDGEKLMDEFIGSNPSHPKAATAYFDLGLFFYDEGNYQKASGYFNKVRFPALTNEQQTEGHFKFGYSLFNQKKLDQALTEFDFVKKNRGPFNPAANYYSGYIEYTKGEYDKALVDLKTAEVASSYSKIVPYLIASCYYKQGKYDDLISYTKGLAGRTDVANAAEIALLEAEAQFYKGDMKTAVVNYEKYFAVNKDATPGALFRAGYANYVAGDSKRGIEYLEKSAASKDTVSYYASYYVGILNLKSGNKANALNAFVYARNNPVDQALAEESAFQAGKVAYDLGKPDQAIDDLEKFLIKYPSSNHKNELKELLAQAYVNGNNYHKALNYIESLPTKNATILQAYQKAAWLMGSELYNKDNYSDALTWFKKSLENPIVPNYTALAAFWAGECESSLGNPSGAIQFYTSVLSIAGVEKDILARTRYGLGYAYFGKKEYVKALPHFEVFAGLGMGLQTYTDGLVRLADCYYVMKRYDEANKTYLKARAAGTTEPDYVLMQSGIISGIRKQYDESSGLLNELITKYSGSPYRNEAIFQKGMFEIESGNYNKALESFGLLIREGHPGKFLPYAYARRAICNFNLKNMNKVVEDYEELIRLFPAHPLAQDVLVPLQDALNTVGRPDEFAKYLAIVKSASPDKKGLDALEFEAAKKFYFTQDYTRSIPALNTFISTYPESTMVPEARFYLGESNYRIQDYRAAIQAFLPLVPQKSFASYSKVISRLGELYFKTGNHRESVTYYQMLRNVSSSKKDLSTAWMGLLDGYYELKQYDSAVYYSKMILEKGGGQPGTMNKAALYLGKIELERGDVESAKDEFLNTLNAAQDVYGAEAKYLIAEIYHNQQNYKGCYETLLELNRDFNTYDLWVGKSFLLLAKNYQAQGNLFQTKATLNSLVEGFPLEEIKTIAKQRLAELEKAELLKKQQLQNDSTDNEK